MYVNAKHVLVSKINKLKLLKIFLRHGYGIKNVVSEETRDPNEKC